MKIKTLLILASLLPVTASSYASEDRYFYWDFGTWFGGDKVAHNPDGDSYDAGSGAILDLGVAWKINNRFNLYSRNTVGFRYQGAKSGDGGNRGVAVESALVKQVGLWNFGAGVHADFANVTKDYDGSKTEFKDAVGGFLIVENMFYEHYGIGAKYLIQDYEAENGDEYSGDQFGVFVAGKF